VVEPPTPTDTTGVFGCYFQPTPHGEGREELNSPAGAVRCGPKTVKPRGLTPRYFTLEIFGVNRARSTVHSWVHKAELRPGSGRSPDHVAVDETVIRLNDEQYWLYAVVDPKISELLYTKLEPTTNKVISHAFFAEPREKHDVDEPCFSLTVHNRWKTLAAVTASISDMKSMEIGIVSNVSFER